MIILKSEIDSEDLSIKDDNDSFNSLDENLDEMKSASGEVSDTANVTLNED